MMRSHPIAEDVAHKIYDVLVEVLGIYVPEDRDDYSRSNFVRYATEGKWTEFRFGNPLGFGGKVWNNDNRWYVSCYREDETPERRALIEKTNAALAELHAEVYKQPDC